MPQYKYIRRFAELGIEHVPIVGGKNASLGEMYRELSSQGVKVPNSSATTAVAFHYYLQQNGLSQRIAGVLARLDSDDVDVLAHAGAEIRGWIINGTVSEDLAQEIRVAYEGFSIGSNDLTQCTLGADRGSGILTGLDERNPAMLKLMEMAIEACNRNGKYVGICGQAPPDFPEITRWLVDRGIQSISLNPDSVLTMTQVVLDMEAQNAEDSAPAREAPRRARAQG